MTHLKCQKTWNKSLSVLTFGLCPVVMLRHSQLLDLAYGTYESMHHRYQTAIFKSTKALTNKFTTCHMSKNNVRSVQLLVVRMC